jgi:asparagine synthase (glutamine-hydrolysing)
MGKTLSHRGPDDEGYYFNGDIGLAHRRLSIIDLTTFARQPMSDPAGRYVLVFNGEVYNYRDIREELEEKGYLFSSSSDTEVVLNAYREWKEGCLSRFIGMFAFALWDNREKSLFLARDRLGIKPLYYYHRDSLFAFSSELKALLRLPSFSKDLDFQALYEYLVFQYVPEPRSIYRHTSKLTPGHYLVVTPQGIEKKCYWRGLDRKEPAVPATEEEHLERFTSLFRDSIKLRQISDVPLGAFLSGGIDSSAVVALMQEQNTTPVRTFSIGFREESYDEAPYARAVAHYLKTDHHELYVTPREAYEVIPLLPTLYDEPFSDSSAIPTYLVSRMARSHVTVSLSGDGGDELFCGYNRYGVMKRLHRLRSLPLSRQVLAMVEKAPPILLEWAGKALKALLFSDMNAKITAQKIVSHARVLRGRSLDAYLGMVQIWEPSLAGTLLRGGPFTLEESTFYRAGKLFEEEREPAKFSFIDMQTYLEGDILTKVDRASMAVGLEARVPLLDHRIVEFARGLPLSFKMRGHQSKYILQKLLYRKVPASLFKRPKQGFGIPLSRWLRGELAYLLHEYLESGRIIREGFFDEHVVSAIKKEHLEGRADHGYRLYNLLMFQMWKERYL